MSLRKLTNPFPITKSIQISLQKFRGKTVSAWDKFYYEDFYYSTPGRWLREAHSNFWWFIEYVQGVYAYAKVRRRCFEFDHSFVLHTLRFSLSRLRGCIARGYHLHKDRDARQIRICEMLCTRLLENKYGDKLWEEFDKRWEGTNTHGWMSSLEDGERLPDPEEKKKISKEVLAIGYYETRQRKQDYKLLFNILERRLESWWD